MAEEIHLQDYIRSRHDLPEAGHCLRDITPLLANGVAFRFAIDRMAESFPRQA